MQGKPRPARTLLGPYEQTGLNPYDVTQQCQYPPLCYDFSKMTAFFNRADVKAAMEQGADEAALRRFVA